MKNEELLRRSHLCLSGLLLLNVSFAGMRRQRLLLQYYFLFIQLKRLRHLSKITFELIRTQLEELLITEPFCARLG